MNKSYKKYYIILLVVFFISVHIVEANIVFNEIQLTPTAERFIEIYNNGSSTVDLTDWYIQRKTGTGTTFGSLVSKTNFKNKSIQSDDYFVISKSSTIISDILRENLTLTESNTIQIKNSNQEVVDILEWGSIPQGMSTQRNSSGDWDINSPTPGYLNLGVSDDNINNQNIIIPNNNSTSSIFTSSPQTNKIYQISTQINSKNIETAGIPFMIDSITTGSSKEIVVTGKFIWNFGDGMTKEVKNSDPFLYTYEYPGEYVLRVDYYKSYYSKDIESTHRMTVRVVSPGIVISSVGSITDPFIEIYNNSKYEIIPTNWIIYGNVHSFIIPQGMIILANKKLKLSPKITGFNYNDLKNINILDSSGTVFASYPEQIRKPIKHKKYKSLNTNSTTSLNNNKNKNIINLNDLSATAVNSNILNLKEIPYIGLVIVLIISITSVILLGRKNESEDYIKKEINASDMTIIE